MKTKTVKDYDELSRTAADVMAAMLLQKPDALFCIATGHSPEKTYSYFIDRVHKEQIDTSKMRIIKLDEWCGLPKSSPATCEYFIQKNIIEPLQITSDRYISFDPLETDYEAECSRIASLISQNNGIDLCLLGIGRNGHLGLNEPCEELNPFIHISQLQGITQTHALLTENHVSANMGYTLGIKNILDSKQVLLLITGKDKKAGYEALQKDFISSNYPANYIKLHNNAICIVDQSFLD